MLNTTITFEGNLASEPELRFTPAGKPILDLTVLVNRRRQDDAGQWVDYEPTRHRVTAFGALAENISGSVGVGARLIVVGDVVTDTWKDKETGDKRVAQKVLADAVGISLRWATAEPVKTLPKEQQI